MNAKNDSTDEATPETPAAAATPPAAPAQASAADGLIQPMGKKPAAKKPAAKKPAVQPVQPAAKAAPVVETVPPVVTPVVPESAPAATEVAPPPPVVETVPPVVVAPAPEASAAPPAPPAVETVPPVVEPMAPAVDAAATGEVSPVAVPAAPSVQTVYVTAPVPPAPKGNRVFGSLMAVAATVVFAAAYAGLVALLMFVMPNLGLVDLQTFLMGPGGIVPVVVFLVGMILWVMLANRASWWSWVIGSLAIGVFTYIVSIGALMLVTGEFSKSPAEAGVIFEMYLYSPIFIAAGFLARETAIWFGAAIAKRGRKVRERNYETFQAFEMEQAQKRAELGGSAAV